MNKGFTMVEFLVVMFIIGILSSVLFFNWKSGEEMFALQSSAYKLAQNIREAQEMAMSAKICAVCGGIVPPRYGIYTHSPDPDSNFYRLFADINNDGMIVYPNPLPEDDIVIKTINYESGVYLSEVILPDDCSPKGPKRGYLTFMPPDPITEIWVGKLGHPFPPVKCSKITLQLSVGASGPTKSVIINQAGLVYIE